MAQVEAFHPEPRNYVGDKRLLKLTREQVVNFLNLLVDNLGSLAQGVDENIELADEVRRLVDGNDGRIVEYDDK